MSFRRSHWSHSQASIDRRRWKRKTTVPGNKFIPTQRILHWTRRMSLLWRRISLSTLANIENCSLSNSSRNYHSRPVQDTPWCRFGEIGGYDALVSVKHILLQEQESAFEFNPLSSPQNQPTAALQHLQQLLYHLEPHHIISESTILHRGTGFHYKNSTAKRKKREAWYLPDSENRQSRFDQVSLQALPLIHRLYSITEISKLSSIETQPIEDPKLLREIKQWNVTNLDFYHRSQPYASEDVRISALRTIRRVPFPIAILAAIHS